MVATVRTLVREDTYALVHQDTLASIVKQKSMSVSQILAKMVAHAWYG